MEQGQAPWGGVVACLERIAFNTYSGPLDFAEYRRRYLRGDHAQSQ